MTHNPATVVSLIALASWAAKHRQILVEWTISTWMVRSSLFSGFPALITLRLALGITEEVEKLGLKGSKKKKGKKLDEDYVVSAIILHRPSDRVEQKKSISPILSLWSSKMFPSLYRLCARRKAERSSSSCSPE
jgi:hypothetical protein